MAKKRNSTAMNYLQYAAVRLLMWILWVLPMPIAVGLGRLGGAIFWAVDKRHRRRAFDQMSLAYRGDMGEREIRQNVWRMYQHFGIAMIELVRLPQVPTEEIYRTYLWHGNDILARKLVAEGKGLIYCTGHVGNWEASGFYGARLGLMNGAIARPLDNPLLNRLLVDIRTSWGMTVYDKIGAMRHVMRDLRRGKSIGILVDQDAGKRGTFVPFFGIPASTLTIVADLAIRTGAPVLVAASFRDPKPMHFRVDALGPLRAIPGAPRDQERIRLTREMNRMMEALIRQHPEQWFWVHRRWKTRPPDETDTPPELTRR